MPEQGKDLIYANDFLRTIVPGIKTPAVLNGGTLNFATSQGKMLYAFCGVQAVTGSSLRMKFQSSPVSPVAFVDVEAFPTAIVPDVAVYWGRLSSDKIPSGHGLARVVWEVVGGTNIVAAFWEMVSGLVLSPTADQQAGVLGQDSNGNDFTLVDLGQETPSSFLKPTG